MSIKTPNREEQIVMDCLIHQGFTDLKYEPDGNVPPDIVPNGNIAIEVRRLNQNTPTEDGLEGLEQSEYAVHSLMKSLMDKFPLQPGVNGAFVGYHIKRPLLPLKQLKKEVQKILTSHLSIINTRKKYHIGNNFELELFPATDQLDKLYKYGMSSDNNSGGFVISLIHENIKLILEEKERKVNNFKLRYPHWWLGLVDNIGYVIDKYDLTQLYQMPKLNTSFDRILLVSPLDPTRFIYL